MTNRPILANPSEAELEAAVRENLYASFRAMQVIPGFELLESDGLNLHHTTLTNPVFRGVWKTSWLPDETESKIDEVLQWFSRRAAPDFMWWTDSQTQPIGLVEHLLRRGFDGNVEGDRGMVADLHALNEKQSLPEGFSIVPAVEQQALNDWRDVFAESNETPVSAGQAWVDAMLSSGPGNAPWQLYVGYLDGQPVATSILFNSAGVAGIYGIGTVPHARNKGIGGAITLRPLLDARQQGYHFAVLFASHMGYPVYKRLGFREVACKIGIYLMESHP